MKTRLREQKLLERLQHDPQLKHQKDKKISVHISREKSFRQATNIIIYLPIHGEADLTELFNKYAAKKQFILPKVQGRQLKLYKVSNLEHVEPGKFGILEPKIHLPQVDPSEADLILVPGVVFSENGHRIGFGKGFYDRLLKKVKCLKVGIAYEFQIVKNIPGEKHDVPMEKIITEARVIQVN